MSWAHCLSARSDFSLGESLLNVDDVIAAAVRAGYRSVALVDTMSLHAAVRLNEQAVRAGIRPVVACRLRVRGESAEKTARRPMQRIFMPKVYVLEECGWRSLLALLSQAHSSSGQVCCRLEDVLALEGVAIASGDFAGLFQHPGWRDVAAALVARFGPERVFAELTPASGAGFTARNRTALQAIADFGLSPLVAWPVLHRDAADRETLAVARAIALNVPLSTLPPGEEWQQEFCCEPPQRLLERVAAVAARYGDASCRRVWKMGVRNIARLAEMCRYRFRSQRNAPAAETGDAVFRLASKCVVGWKRRLTVPVLGYMPSRAQLPAYRERLHHELSALERCGLAGYFLLIEETATWAKRNRILAGPGRGSLCGSLVAYLLGLTDVDPLRFELLFERFLTPQRADLPDVDMDFMSSRRQEVIHHLIGRQGSDNVAGISSCVTLSPLSALRDVARICGVAADELTGIKRLPHDPSGGRSLEEAAQRLPVLAAFRERHPQVWRHACRLAGRARSFSRHAAGMVVATEPLRECAVVEMRDGMPVLQWDKHDVTRCGLMKFDILGLTTLDRLAIARETIQRRHGVTVAYTALPLAESDVMAAFGRGATIGVFQCESPGMRRLLRSLARGQALSFADLITAVALHRPGPIACGLPERFIAARRDRREMRCEHVNMRPALRCTHGVLVYQEQIVQLAVEVAGFSPVEADRLRQAMSGKDREAMTAARRRWLEGCAAHSGMDAATAATLFARIEAFAGYAFNRSHAVAYAILSYWTMWLRVRYPVEFFAACLSTAKAEKRPALQTEARHCGITVMPPDINRSTEQFTVIDDHHILAPLCAVGSVSVGQARAIVSLRAAMPRRRFASVQFFEAAIARVRPPFAGRAVEALRQAGAFAAIPALSPQRRAVRRHAPNRLLRGLRIAGEAAKDGIAPQHSVASPSEAPPWKVRTSAAETIALQQRRQTRYVFVIDRAEHGCGYRDSVAEEIHAAAEATGIASEDMQIIAFFNTAGSPGEVESLPFSRRQRLEDELTRLRPRVIVVMGRQARRCFLRRLASGGTGADSVMYDTRHRAAIVIAATKLPGTASGRKEAIDSVFAKAVALAGQW